MARVDRGDARRRFVAVATIVYSVTNPVPITFAETGGVGTNGAAFAILAKPVTVVTPVTISASYNGATTSATLTVLPQDPPPTLTRLAVVPQDPLTGVVGGSVLQVTPWLSGPSQNNGTVALSSSNPAVLLCRPRHSWARAALRHARPRPPPGGCGRSRSRRRPRSPSPPLSMAPA